MSSMNPKAKSGNDPSAHQGGESSANPQDQNKSKTVNSEEDNLNQTNNKAEEDCGECWVRRFLKKGECKDLLIEEDNCMEAEDGVNKCRDARMKLRTCMYANMDYYGPYLVKEKEALTHIYKQSLKELEMLEEAEAVAAAKKKESDQETKGK